MKKNIMVDQDIFLEIVNEKHAAPIFNLVNENREYLKEWLPWVSHMATPEFIENFISVNQKAYMQKTDFAYVIYLNDRIVGRIGLYNMDHSNKTGSIGYWVADNYQGKGIVTRSCKTLINHAFNDLNINRIEIRCGTENYKSQAIPERLGFTKEGRIRQGEAFHDKFIDLYSYSLLRQEWAAYPRVTDL